MSAHGMIIDGKENDPSYGRGTCGRAASSTINTGERFPMSTDQCKGIPLPEQRLPVYVTRQVGARMTGVADRTFGKYAVPVAWRREYDGKLAPLYDEQAVEQFRVTYCDGRGWRGLGGAE
jgi:hypothetical protein